MSEQTTGPDPLKDLASKLISVTEAARISGLTTGHLRKLLREGQIEGVKIGNLSWLAFQSRKWGRGCATIGEMKEGERVSPDLYEAAGELSGTV